MAFCVVSDHIIVIRAFPACETNKWFAYSCIFFFFFHSSVVRGVDELIGVEGSQSFFFFLPSFPYN